MKKHLSTIITLLLFVGVVVAVGFGVMDVRSDHNTEQLAVQKRAIERAAVLCYAVEGAYPPRIEYLEEHYGLIVDRDKFIVKYETFGANIRPEVKVWRMNHEQTD